MHGTMNLKSVSFIISIISSHFLTFIIIIIVVVVFVKDLYTMDFC